MKWIIRNDKDKKIKLCCLQSKAAEPYMKVCGLDREDVLRRFLFVEGPGLYHQGSAGISFLLFLFAVGQSCKSTLSQNILADDGFFYPTFLQLL